MTLQTTLRVLAAEELIAVSGGDEDEIVVVGTRQPDTFLIDQFFDLRFAFDASLLGMTNLLVAAGLENTIAEDTWNPDGDDDGDGIPNSDEEIVVVAPLGPTVALSGDYYARYDYSNNVWLIWEDDIIWDDFAGYFIPGTPDNHNFVTQDSDWTVTIGINVPGRGGAEGEGGTSGGGVEYWIRVPPPTDD